MVTKVVTNSGLKQKGAREIVPNILVFFLCYPLITLPLLLFISVPTKMQMAQNTFISWNRKKCCASLTRVSQMCQGSAALLRHVVLASPNDTSRSSQPIGCEGVRRHVKMNEERRTRTCSELCTEAGYKLQVTSHGLCAHITYTHTYKSGLN